MSRTSALSIPLLLLSAAAASGGPPEATAPRNVLFLASDDMRPDLGCYGSPVVKSPNLDALARRGVRFDRAYCQYPLCNPSRTSMLTGRHPTTTGVMDNSRWFRADHPEFVSLPQHFRANGYTTARVGKIYHGGIDDAESWAIGGEPRQFQGATRPARPGGQDPAQSDRIVVLDGEGEDHADFKNAARAVALLEQLKAEGKPFFLAVGFSKPHSPPTAPRKMLDLYDPAKMPLPVDFQARPTVPDGFPTPSVPPRSGDLFIGRDASPEEAREVVRAYYASITFCDAQVGRVLEALDRLGLRDSTVVTFFGDHGYHLGEKGKWSKHNSLFEVGTRVPMMIDAPGMPGNGKACNATVGLIDFIPTLADLCGLPMPGGLEGHSLVPLLKDPAAPWDHPAYTVTRFQGVLGETVRTPRWRFTRYDGGKAGTLLFDEQTDPHETKNLADDPARAGLVKELNALIDRRGKTGP